MQATGERTGRTADRAEEASEYAGRAGLGARGIVYCAAAVLAARVALGSSGERVDKEGAIAGVARQPFGSALVVVLIAGFLGYAVWRVARAITGASEGGSQRTGASGAAKRALDLGRAGLYVVLAWTALRFLVDAPASDGANEREREWTARLLDEPYGEWIVGLAGAVLIGIGAWFVVRGVRQDFTEKLDLSDAPPMLRAPFTWLGTAGHVARGAVVGAIGWFVIAAAVDYDPEEAVGVDGALKRMLGEPWGRPAVVAVAIGLAAFGLFSFVEARYRKVLEG
jgi:hypothetical protein